ncbi:hypothetical protein [Bacteroides stercorirosoris]|nr:hypothetical protein [Bacteroides stercorirosoris]
MRKIYLVFCFFELIISIHSLAQNDICSYCNGSSKVKCDECNGDNHANCIKCHGTGFIRCPFKNAYPVFHPVVVESMPTSLSQNIHTDYHNSTKTNSDSKYSALNNPNLVDNSEKIKQSEKGIKELEYKKQHCSYCHGTGKVPGNYCYPCRGTGTIKIGYYTPQFFPCNWCGGKGRSDVACTECQKTNMAISFVKLHLENLKETHGMTKETEQFYYEHKNKMAQMDRDYQNSINAIADSYLDKPSNKSSVYRHSNGEPLCPDCKGSGKCHICKGDKLYENSYDNYRITNCDFCKQTGVCPMCHGRGTIR